MKFVCSVDISLPRERVIELFDNPENMVHWQDGFVSFTSKNGVPGEPGSTAIIKYKIGNRDMELLETVTNRNLPNEFHGSYEWENGKNLMYNYFEEIDAETTRWVAKIDYIESKGFMMWIMKNFFSHKFPQQTQKWMDQFKVFAEGAYQTH